MKIDLNLLDARDLLAKKEISSHELTKIYLDNICHDEDNIEINKNDCNGFNYNIHYPSQYESLSYFTNDFKNCKELIVKILRLNCNIMHVNVCGPSLRQCPFEYYFFNHEA